MHKELFAQGDIILERVADVKKVGAAINVDPDKAVVLARGEVTGHRHAFYSGATMFRDDALALDIPAELYLGHVKIAAKNGAALKHEEHETINLSAGTYRVRRQREWTAEQTRVVED